MLVELGHEVTCVRWQDAADEAGWAIGHRSRTTRSLVWTEHHGSWKYERHEFQLPISTDCPLDTHLRFLR